MLAYVEDKALGHSKHLSQLQQLLKHNRKESKAGFLFK